MSIIQTLMTSTLGSFAPPTPSYTLYSYGGSDVGEGNNLVFIAGGSNIPDGTYYWTIETNAGDFATSSGSFTINSNNGSFIVSPTADATSEGTETFTVALREGSTSGTILVTSNTVTINDTSFSTGSFVINGTTFTWNASSNTHRAYIYPDNSRGSVHTLTGTQYVLSPQFGVSPTLNFNLWFYPTANNCQIMSEFGQAQENSGWHYSMLEIDSSNKLKGRIWQMGATFPTPVVTSTGSVTLNAWNHVHLYYNPSNTTFGMSLNNETAVTQGGITRQTPDTNHTYWGIGTYSSQTMGSSARYQGRFDGLVIDTTLVGSNYTATKSKYEQPTAILNLDAGNVASYPGSGTVWTDTVGNKEFTLFNGPTYNSANGGYLNFVPSSNQYAEATSFPDSLTNWTLEAWHYYDGTLNLNASPCIVTEVYAGTPINFTLGNCTDTSPNVQVGHWDGGSFNPTPTGTVLTTGQWYHLVGTFDGTAHRLYVNGQLAQIQATTSPATRGGVGIRLMCRWDAPQFWGGRLAVVRIYGAAMNPDGILSNFNSTKSRYGL